MCIISSIMHAKPRSGAEREWKETGRDRQDSFHFSYTQRESPSTSGRSGLIACSYYPKYEHTGHSAPQKSSLIKEDGSLDFSQNQKERNEK